MGNEFGAVEALWSQFEGVMAQEPEGDGKEGAEKEGEEEKEEGEGEEEEEEEDARGVQKERGR